MKEYHGALAALAHIVRMRWPQSKLRLDSLLVTNQLLGKLRCLAPNLQPFYERGLSIIENIKTSTWYCSLSIQHVYREFNADADATANECIDLAIRHNRTASIYHAVNDDWDLLDLPMQDRMSLTSRGLFIVS